MSDPSDDDFNNGATVVGMSYEDQLEAALKKQQEEKDPNADPFGATAIAPSYEERLAAMGLDPNPEPPEAATEVAGMSYDQRLQMMEENPPKTMVLPEMGGAALPPPMASGPSAPSSPTANEPPPPMLVGKAPPPPRVHPPAPAAAQPHAAAQAPAPGGGGFQTPGQQQWGVAPTMALDSSTLGLPGSGPGSAPGVAPAGPGAPPLGSAPGLPNFNPGPASAPQMQAAAPQKKGMSPVVMMAIGAGAVFLVGAFLMAIVVAIFMLR